MQVFSIVPKLKEQAERRRYIIDNQRRGLETILNVADATMSMHLTILKLLEITKLKTKIQFLHFL